MSRSFFSPLTSELVKVICFAGATIYLAVFAIAPGIVWGFWSPDYLWAHGEPLLIISLAFGTGFEAIQKARRLPDKI